PPPPPAAPAKPAVPVAQESEFELDQDYELVIEPEALVPAHEQRPPAVPIVPAAPEPVAQNAAPPAPSPATSSSFASDQFLSDLASEIDQLGIGELKPTFSSSPTQPTAPASNDRPAAPNPVASGPLKEVFEEFRAELGEMGAEDEDL